MAKTSFINRANEFGARTLPVPPFHNDFMYACAGVLYSHTTSFQVRKLSAQSALWEQYNKAL